MSGGRRATPHSALQFHFDVYDPHQLGRKNLQAGSRYTLRLAACNVIGDRGLANLFGPWIRCFPFTALERLGCARWLTSDASIRCLSQIRVMLQAGNSGNTQTSYCENQLARTSQVRLGFARTYYTMAQALGLQKLQDFMRVNNVHGMATSKGHFRYRSLFHCAGITYFNNRKWPNLAFGCRVQNNSSRAGCSRSAGELHT